jgi:uncharacterized metal-binding protein YceD (DUF177 family)
MTASEFSRVVDAQRLPGAPLRLEANEVERTALAKRFALVAVRSLVAEVSLTEDSQAILATGRLKAEIVQSCAISGEELPVAIDEPLALRFVRDPEIAGEEIERFDLGEEIAQSLGLAIDPYAVSPGAEAIRAAGLLADEAASGPFAALAALKKS